MGLISLSRLAAAQDPCIICPPDPGPNYFVGVSPDNQSAGPYAARVTGQQLTFTIANGGSQPAAYGLSCSSTGNVTCTALSKSETVWMPSGGQDDVVATFTTGAVGSGTLIVTASGFGVSDQGSYSISIAYDVAVTPDGQATPQRRNNTGGYTAD